MKNTETINEIHYLYDEYIKKVQELEQNKKITDGLLGITKGPKDDPCHERFADDLESRLQALESGDPDPEDVYSVLEFMYTVPLKYKDNHMVYWMFLAVHSLALNLTSRLAAEDAERLYEQYGSDYPRWERLPAQKKTLKALKSRISAS